MSVPVVVAGIALVFGLGGNQVRQFERAAARDLASKLGGNDKKVAVRAKLNGILGGALGDLSRVTIEASHFTTKGLPLFTEPDRDADGKVRTLELKLTDFEISGLRCAFLEATIPDCRFDYGLALSQRKIRLSRSGVGTGKVRLKERDLEAFILKKFKEIKRVSVSLRDGRALVSGYGEFLVIDTKFVVEASLGSTDGKSISLVDCQISFDGKPAEAQTSRVLLETLNPVVDFEKDLGLFDAVSVQGTRIGTGWFEAWGATKIPSAPAKSDSR